MTLGVGLLLALPTWLGHDGGPAKAFVVCA